MTAEPGRDYVRAVGEHLDRAVHLTFARFALVVPAFVLADALGGLLQFAPLHGVAAFLALTFAGMVFENRARVIVIASLHRAEHARADWAQVVRHPAALAFAVIGMLDPVIPWLAIGVVGGVVAAILRLPAIVSAAGLLSLVYVVGFAIVLVIGAALLIALLLVALAAVAATIDTVIDGIPPHRALGRWLGRAFRPRLLVPTLVVAAVFALLVAGVPMLLAFIIPWGPPAFRAVVDAIPEGIADAVGLLFAWRWRDAEVNRRDGRDIELLLEACDAPGATRSPPF